MREAWSSLMRWTADQTSLMKNSIPDSASSTPHIPLRPPPSASRTSSPSSADKFYASDSPTPKSGTIAGKPRTDGRPTGGHFIDNACLQTQSVRAPPRQTLPIRKSTAAAASVPDVTRSAPNSVKPLSSVTAEPLSIYRRPSTRPLKGLDIRSEPPASSALSPPLSVQIDSAAPDLESPKPPVLAQLDTTTIPHQQKQPLPTPTDIVNSLTAMLLEYREDAKNHGGISPDGDYYHHALWKKLATIIKDENCIRLLDQDTCQKMMIVTSFLKVSRVEERIRCILKICEGLGYNIGRMGFHLLMKSVIRKPYGLSYCQRVINEMEQSGNKPNQRTYILYLEALLHNTSVRKGVKWVEHAVAQVPVTTGPTNTNDDFVVQGTVEVTQTDNTDRVNNDDDDTSPLITKQSTLQRDIYVYTALMKGFYREGRFKDALCYAEKARNEGLAFIDGTHVIIMKTYIKLKDLAAATHYFEELIAKGTVRNRIMYEVMIEGWLSLLQPTKQRKHPQAYSGDALSLGNLLRSSNNRCNVSTTINPGVEPQEANVEAAVSSPVNPGASNGTPTDDNYYLQMATKMYRDMVRKGIAPGVHTYTIFMSTHLRQQQYGAVLALYKDLLAQKLHPSVIAYTMAMTAAMALHDFNLVEKLFEQARQIDDGVLDLQIYSTYLSSLGKAGKSERVDQVFQEILQAGLVPNLFTWDTYLHSKCAGGDVISAERVVDQMQARGWSKSVRIYNMLIYAHCVAGNVTAATHRLIEMRSTGLQPDIMTYNTLIWGHHRNGDVEGGMQRYTQMLSAGIEPDKATFNILIAANARRLDAIGAMDAFQQLLSSNMRPDLYSLVPLMDVHAHRGNISIVKDGINMLREHDMPTTAPLNILLGFKSRNNDLKGLVEEFFNATQAATTEPIPPDIRTFDILVRAFGTIGDAVQAQQWFDEAIKYDIKPDTMLYNALLHAYVKAGDVDGAHRVYNQMHLNGLKPDMATWSILPPKSLIPPTAI
ncbi:hypothetical protein SeMB42_g05784 [Synchytrium endobioticum]|uniref:Pentacotripeptide-repeat region of PRORP domain-containing protein n=1 Tax=Synchytrium endobioticum TaxID=286115 RepID=A0A507CPD4_9FUNG|nr:hypothetical protein SeMB42_g05784 [Synchytrium endobioticum]